MADNENYFWIGLYNHCSNKMLFSKNIAHLKEESINGNHWKFHTKIIIKGKLKLMVTENIKIYNQSELFWTYLRFILGRIVDPT